MIPHISQDKAHNFSKLFSHSEVINSLIRLISVKTVVGNSLMVPDSTGENFNLDEDSGINEVDRFPEIVTRFLITAHILQNCEDLVDCIKALVCLGDPVVVYAKGVHKFGELLTYEGSHSLVIVEAGVVGTYFIMEVSFN